MNPLDQLLTSVTDAIARAGGTPYLVGGAVRDALLGLESKDLDILVTNLEPETLKSLLETVGKVDLVGKSFGVFKVSKDGETLDVALPRLEKSTGTHHRDFEVSYDAYLPLEVDLERRDLTVNAMAWRLMPPGYGLRVTGNRDWLERESDFLIDPFGGRADLERRILRAVGDARARFEDDPLRMLRLARFIAKLDFEVEAGTALAVLENAHLIDTVALERVQIELMGLLSAKHPEGVLRALRFLRDSGLLERILPEFKATYGYDQQNPHHHLTLDEHIFEAVCYAVQHGFDLLSRLALLLHDLGKPQTQSFGDDGVAHYYKHEVVGSEIAARVLERLKFPLEIQKSVTKLVFEHMRPPLDSSTRVLRRFVNDLGLDWERALEVRVADRMAHAPQPDFDARGWLEGVRERALKVSAELESFDERQLSVSGLELIAHFGVTGSQIGDLKKLAARAVVEGEVVNEKGAVLGWLERLWTNRSSDALEPSHKEV